MSKPGYLPQEAVAAMQRELREQLTAALARLAVERASNENYAKKTHELLDERERLLERAEAANALLRECLPCVEYCTTLDNGSWAQEHPDYYDLARHIRAHLEGK